MFEARRESVLRYALESFVDSKPVDNKSVDAGVILREDGSKGHCNLRGNADDDAFRTGVEAALKARLPVTPGYWSAAADASVYWLGPNEWLLLVAAGREADVQRNLRHTLSGHFSIVDISGGQTLINLSGDAVDFVLKKSCTYDFHPLSFGQGRCVQTTFAKATALVARKKDGSYDLVIRRSLADYLFRWIANAAAEYGFSVER